VVVVGEVVVICWWPWYRDTRWLEILVCEVARHVWMREGGVQKGDMSSVKRSISI